MLHNCLTLWLSSPANERSGCTSLKGLLWTANKIIKFFLAKHSTNWIGRIMKLGKQLLVHTELRPNRWYQALRVLERHRNSKAAKTTVGYMGLEVQFFLEKMVWGKLPGRKPARAKKAHQAFPGSPKCILSSLVNHQESTCGSQRLNRNLNTSGWSP